MRAINLSPLDGAQLPGVFPALPVVAEGETLNYSRDEFFALCEKALCRMHENILNEREKKRIEQQARIRSRQR